jgi:hypothetical protein
VADRWRPHGIADSTGRLRRIAEVWLQQSACCCRPLAARHAPEKQTFTKIARLVVHKRVDQFSREPSLPSNLVQRDRESEG